MDEQIFLEQKSDKLQEVLDKLSARDELKGTVKELTSKNKTYKKELTDIQKEFDKSLENDIKREREKYISVESKNLSEANSKLKKEKSSRGKAKRIGIKQRIEAETKDLILQNRALHRQIRKSLQEKDLPSYCDSNWFYTLYYTQGFKEFLIKILFFLIGLIGLPFLIVQWMNHFWLFKIFEWILVDGIFLAIYITIRLLSKDKDDGIIEELREFRDQIHDNERQIRQIKKKIKQDRDESQYDLDIYDENISDINERIGEISRQKKIKEEEFDSDKKPELIEQIENKYIPLIEKKQKEIEQNEQILLDTQNQLENANQEIEEQYEKYLTKSLTNRASIEKMIAFIDSGEAENISQALNLVKK